MPDQKALPDTRLDWKWPLAWGLIRTLRFIPPMDQPPTSSNLPKRVLVVDPHATLRTVFGGAVRIEWREGRASVMPELGHDQPLPASAATPPPPSP